MVRDVPDRLRDRRRLQPVLAVVAVLDAASPLRLVDGRAHARRHVVGVHHDSSLDVPRRPPDRLDQRAVRAQVPFFVGVEDRHERHLGQVQPLPQQVDPHHHVVHPQPQVPQDLDPVERLHLRVQVVRLHPHLREVVRQVLRHLLRQRRDQHSLPLRRRRVDLRQQVVDLPVRRAHLHHRVEHARRTDHLLRHLRRLVQLVLRRRRAHEDRLVDVLVELLERQRPVVERAR